MVFSSCEPVSFPPTCEPHMLILPEFSVTISLGGMMVPSVIMVTAVLAVFCE